MTERLEADTLVDGRYRVLYRLGSGGMADVYCAEDQQLGRKVALKILYRRFAADEEFVERFRREASSAAGLQHPNVVAVYDRGAFDGTYYIAMEYLEGRSLKQVIHEESPMDPTLAIDYTLQVLKAARFAHSRGIIHRDLKPQNVIVDSEGRAKVTDFGIARAGASDMTQTGSIMGTAQYLSPEQAQGHAVGPTSDIYSVGIILYELLTGRVPFDGESAVTIALKQVGEAPVPPSQFNTMVTPELEQVTLIALNKNPGDRYQDDDQFIAALEQAKRNLPAPGTYTNSYLAVAPAGEAYTQATQPPYPPEEDPADKRKWWLWGGLAALIVAAIVLAIVLAGGDSPKQVKVPNAVGLTESAAQKALEAEGFSTDTKEQKSNKKVGTVLAQDPEADTKADEGSTVTLTVSSGPGKVAVPDVTGLGQNAAETALTDAGFKVKITNATSDTVPAKHVISTSPKAGTQLPPGSVVEEVVSEGKAEVAVPNVVGSTVEDARSQLQAKGFGVETTQEVSDQDPGTVLSQSPGGGATAKPGATVNLVVAKASDEVPVPDVTGDDEGSATNELEAAGFSVKVTEEDVDTPTQDGIVQSQTPSGGKAKKGSQVTILVGRTGEVPTTPTTPDDTGGTGGAGAGGGAG